MSRNETFAEVEYKKLADISNFKRWYSGKVDATEAEVSFFCGFIPLMFVTCPVFHPHYVSMALPLVMVLLVILWERYSYGHIPPGGRLCSALL